MKSRRFCVATKQEWLTMPISNLPPGTTSVRRKFRIGHVGQAFVRTPDGITHWLLADDGETLSLVAVLGGNSNEPRREP